MISYNTVFRCSDQQTTTKLTFSKSFPTAQSIGQEHFQLVVIKAASEADHRCSSSTNRCYAALWQLSGTHRLVPEHQRMTRHIIQNQKTMKTQRVEAARSNHLHQLWLYCFNIDSKISAIRVSDNFINILKTINNWDDK